VKPRLLDLTRLVSRLGGAPLTGIDRVELAWLQGLVADQTPCFALVRTRVGFSVLDRRGMAAILQFADGVPLPKTDLLGRLSRRTDPVRARAETAARAVAMGNGSRAGLTRLLRRLPHDGVYMTMGHANLTDPVMTAMRRRGYRIVALVHDTIPLDHPQFASAGTPAAFAAKLAVIACHADLTVFSTATARRAAVPHLTAAGRVPPAIVAPLGVHRPVPGPLPKLPPGPWFLAVGTIEPRKNHAFLFDLWERMADPPTLCIVGRRGWADPALFARLDTLKARLPQVVEFPALDDAGTAALMAGARALLFPTHAEGFGLPPVEAAALGTPVIANDLPVLREVLGDAAVYLNVNDPYAWLDEIRRLADLPPDASRRPTLSLPTWAGHMKAVLSAV
jgi:glycosyltransferase involved in cell wall biosynthesis